MTKKIEVTLPFLGKVPAKQLAFCGVIIVLAAAEVIDWPIAAVLAAGHLIAHSHLNERLKALGEGMEEV